MTLISPILQQHWRSVRPTDREHVRRCASCTLRGADLCQVIQEESPPGSRPPVTRRFEGGKPIVGRGETNGFFGVLRRGYVRQEQMRLNGDRVLLGLACPGDIVGGLPQSASLWSSEAATDIEVCLFDPATVDRLMRESSRFRQVIAREADHRHQRILRSAWQRNALDSRERIIAFLVDATGLMPTEPQPDGSLILTMEISRRDWADLTNTAVETISRTMRYLSDKRMVDRLTPSKFRIRDLDRLTFIAGMDPTQRLPDQQGSRLWMRGGQSSPESSRSMMAVNARRPVFDRLPNIPDSAAAPKRQ